MSVIALRDPAPTNAVPVGWRSGPILDFFQLQRGHDLPVQDRKSGDVPVMASNGAVGFHDHSELGGPGVVTGRSGTIGNVSYIEGAYWPLNTTLYVRDFKGSDPRFVFYFLQNFPLKNHQSGTGVPTLNRNDVHAVEAVFPPFDEQRRIAEVLRSVDEAIATAEAAVKQWQVTFDKLLDAVFDNDNPAYPLAEICSLIYRYPGFYGFEPLNSGVPVVRGEHLRAGRISTKWDDFYFVKPEFSAQFPKTVLAVDDVVMSVRGTVGTTAVVDAAHVGSQISPNLIRIVADPSKILPPLLFFAVQSAVAHIRRTIVNAQALPAINAGDLKRIEIALPPLRDQSDLLHQLQAASQASADAARSAKQARETKSELMSDLLSGHVRVPA